MKVTKFDFMKKWHLVEPHLNDPDVLESLDDGMLCFSQHHRYAHMPPWNRKNGLGPWQYSLVDYHGEEIFNKMLENSDVYRLDEKYEDILNKMGVDLGELDIALEEFLFTQNSTKLKKVADSYSKERQEIEKKHWPKKNSYKWHQCFSACFNLADWQETLAEKVYPKYIWRTCQKFKKNEKKWDAGHSTTIGKDLNGNFLIFDILLFESTSVDEILEAAGVDQRKLEKGIKVKMGRNIVFKITEKNVDLYKEFRHKLPCVNGECLVSMMCFNEKKASRKAKRLKYTVTLKDPCPQANRIMNSIIKIPDMTEKLRNHILNANLYSGTLEDYISIIA